MADLADAAPFAALMERASGEIAARLCNALVALPDPLGGLAVQRSCMYDVQSDSGSPFDAIAPSMTRVCTTWLFASESAPKEGDIVMLFTADAPLGRSARISSSVERDAQDWCKFSILV